MEASLTTVPGNAELECIVRADLHLMDLLCAAREINLPQCRVVAGCIYQSVWNLPRVGVALPFANKHAES